jgi:pyrimidine operon attenuation protein/uracil phosphoribosyltransferase
MSSVQILDEAQIAHKLKRMAYEIWERNADEQEVIIFGIENSGAIIAQNIVTILKKISPLKIEYFPLEIDKDNPARSAIALQADIDAHSVVIIDDVANSGKTLMYALKPFLEKAARKIQIAVLVDRNHKSFPINPDIVGHTVSTTLQEHIRVRHDGKKLTGAFLE